MDFSRLDQTLRDSLADLRLSVEERDELRELGQSLSPDAIRYLRNRAFALVRELVAEPAQAQPALKWLEQVLVTPRFHHWHHAERPIDKNFAIHFPWIDRLFGTYHLPPDGSWPPEVGIKGDPVPAEFGAQFTWPFKR